MDDALLRVVVNEYTREAGVRQLERELGTLLRKIATRITSGKATPPVTVDDALVRDALGRQKFFQEAVERTAVPGVATGLAVTGTGGECCCGGSRVPNAGRLVPGQLATS
jgi:ATP-dependent Lon protease